MWTWVTSSSPLEGRTITDLVFMQTYSNHGALHSASLEPLVPVAPTASLGFTGAWVRGGLHKHFTHLCFIAECAASAVPGGAPQIC